MKHLVRLGWLVTIIVGLTLTIGFFLSPQDQLSHADAIVVISGGETQERVAEGVRLFQQDWAPLMIMSGAARDEGVSNAATMQRLAIASGVPADKILLEEEARNTFGNAKNVRNLVGEHGISSIILVTSPYHQHRAALTFRHFLGANFPIINHSATDSAWRKNGWWLDAWARHLTWTELQKIAYLPLLFRLDT